METENHYYLVLEMVRGGDLMTHICNNKRLSEQEAQKYTRQIISAVEYLHSMGIVHRYGHQIGHYNWWNEFLIS